MVTEPGFSSPHQPDRERATAYHDSSGSNSRSDARGATIVGEWEEPSGDSRVVSKIDVEEIMLGWVKCADPNGETIFVNLANAMSMVWNDREGHTTIAFPGGERDVLLVQEKPESILPEGA